MRFLFLFLCLLMFADQPSHAAGEQAGDAKAAERWHALDDDAKTYVQLCLVAAGYQVGLIDPKIDDGEFAAIRRFQAAHGFEQTAILDRAQFKALVEDASPALKAWKLRRTLLPQTGIAMWIPAGFDVRQSNDPLGPRYEAPGDKLLLNLTYLKNSSLDAAYSGFMKMIKSGNGQISYNKLQKNTIFYIQAFAKERLFSTMYVPDRKNLSGYFMTVDISEQKLFGRRLEIVVASSFFMSVARETIPSPDIQDIFRDDDEKADQKVGATDTSQAQNEPEQSSGTGIVLNAAGDVLTNAHVVDGCRELTVLQGTVPTTAIVVAVDKANDLAVVRSKPSAATYPNFRIGARLGESVAAFGYPLSGLLASSGNFTLGNITALSGMGDDSRFIQVSTPVQPGNSGGPLLDANGNLVGIISSGLNALAVMQVSGGDIPQNVNFAIKASVAMTFLESRGIAIQAVPASKALAAPDLADAAKSFAVFLKCTGAPPHPVKQK